MNNLMHAEWNSNWWNSNRFMGFRCKHHKTTVFCFLSDGIEPHNFVLHNENATPHRAHRAGGVLNVISEDKCILFRPKVSIHCSIPVLEYHW